MHVNNKHVARQKIPLYHMEEHVTSYGYDNNVLCLPYKCIVDVEKYPTRTPFRWSGTHNIPNVDGTVIMCEIKFYYALQHRLSK